MGTKIMLGLVVPLVSLWASVAQLGLVEPAMVAWSDGFISHPVEIDDDYYAEGLYAIQNKNCSRRRMTTNIPIPERIAAFSGNRARIMIDSGAAGSVTKKDRYKMSPQFDKKRRNFVTVDGTEMEHHGTERHVTVKMDSGRNCKFRMAETNSELDVLAVGEGLDTGNWFVFGPDGSFITRQPIEAPPDAEFMARQGNHFLLEGDIIDKPAATMAPMGEINLEPFDPLAEELLRQAIEAMDDEVTPMEEISDNTALADLIVRRGNRNLEIPQMPHQSEVDLHNLTHIPQQNWCKWCVEGNHRGNRHVMVLDGNDNRIELDYTFYTMEGFQCQDSDDRKSATQLTAVDRRTGMKCALVVKKKGAWDYAELVLCKFLTKLGRKYYELRGDAEFALQNFIRNVKGRWERQATGQEIKVESGTVGSHQSIGAAEQAHDTIAGQVRTQLAMVKEYSGVEIRPVDKLFVWLVKWSVDTLNKNAVRAGSKAAPHYLAFDVTDEVPECELSIAS